MQPRRFEVTAFSVRGRKVNAVGAVVGGAVIGASTVVDTVDVGVAVDVKEVASESVPIVTVSVESTPSSTVDSRHFARGS